MRLLLPVALGLIGLECALGVALIAHAFPTWLVPGTIGLLLVFSGLTLWGTSSGRVEDCGCYGGLLAVTPVHSVLLNLGYGVLLGLAWLFPVADARTALWQAVLPLVAQGRVRFEGRSQRPERVLLPRFFVAQDAGQEAGYRLHDYRRRQLAAAQNIVADGKFISSEALGHALVNAFVAPAHQHDTCFPRQLLGHGLF